MTSRPVARALTSLLLLAASQACDCGEAVQTFEPSLDVSDDPISFDLVALGDTVTRDLELRAATPPDVELTLSIEGDPSFHLVEPVPSLIPGNTTVRITVAFTPTAVDVFAGTLVVASNDPDPAHKHRILLSGEGKSPQIEVLPDHLDFSAVACPPAARSIRCKDTQSVVVRNAGLVDLTLGTLEIKGTAGTAAPANLRFAKLVNASVLTPGATVEVPIEWKPSQAQAPTPPGADFEAALLVPSNDPGHPALEIPLHAHADANRPPEACVNVLKITKRAYDLDANQRPIVTTRDVPASEWLVDCARPDEDCTAAGLADGDIRVRPGMTIELSSLRLDPAEESASPCTFDPEGEDPTRAWSLVRPAESRASITATSRPATDPVSTLPSVPAGFASFEVDAVGTYDVTLQARDSILPTPGSATVRLKAVPRDDLFVQISWDDQPDATFADLDLHLFADAGPNLGGPADYFCEQDTFFDHRVMTLFDTARPPVWPQVVRDARGGDGRLETATLLEAPPNSRFRVGVQYYVSSATTPPPITPTISLRVKGVQYGPYRPVDPLGMGDGWAGVQVDFPATGQPSVTPISQRRTGLHYDAADGVGGCP